MHSDFEGCRQCTQDSSSKGGVKTFMQISRDIGNHNGLEAHAVDWYRENGITLSEAFMRLNSERFIGGIYEFHFSGVIKIP